MDIAFTSSERASLGVEWELQLVDLETRELASAATDILREIGADHPDGEHPKAKHELLESTIEIITGICGTVAEASADLAGTLAEVTDAAARRGLGVICAGTHPFTDWKTQEISDNPRYHQLVEDMQWLARRLQIFGVHVHVGVRSRDKVIPIVNALTAYIPHLLALSASSPYWIGTDTGLASARSKVFEGLPTAGLPYQLGGWDQFEAYMETLITSHTIESIREVWWDIRPHPMFGTVELRIFDGLPTLAEVGTVAALGQCLVELFDKELDKGYTLPTPTGWVVRENKWRAARYGLDADIIVDAHGRTIPVREALTDLVAELSPTASRLGCLDEIRPSGRHPGRWSELPTSTRCCRAEQRRHACRRRLAARRDAGRRAAVNDVRWLDDWLTAHTEELIAVRRQLHAHPELGHAEHATTALVEQRLTNAGLVPRRLPIGTGLTCDIGVGEPLIALRADLDALPVADTKDVPYRSTVPGVCHACGHDVHTTALLGAGLALGTAAPTLPGTVRLLFQPAEELIPGGALDVIAANALSGITSIVALHCHPRLDAGLVGLRTGPLTAAADAVEVRLEGPGGHTARPQLTVDLVGALARIAVEVPTAVAPLSLVWGAVLAGDASNVIPSMGWLRGSVRTMDAEAWDRARDIVTEAVISAAAPSGATVHVEYRHGVPPVVNDAHVVDLLRAGATATLGARSVVDTEVSMGGEDFGWYLQTVPGAMARLGVHRPGSGGDLAGSASGELRRRRVGHRGRRTSAGRLRGDRAQTSSADRLHEQRSPDGIRRRGAT